MTSESDFFPFLTNALDALALEVPRAYAAFCRELRGLSLCIRVDGQCRYLRTSVERHVLEREPSDAPGLAISTSRDALLELLEDRCAFVDAVRSEACSLQGSIQDLTRLEEALFIFVRGAARSQTAVELFIRFQKGVNVERGRAAAEQSSQVHRSES
jgi:hypothetical protein